MCGSSARGLCWLAWRCLWYLKEEMRETTVSGRERKSLAKGRRGDVDRVVVEVDENVAVTGPKRLPLPKICSGRPMYVSRELRSLVRKVVGVARPFS
ncbi:hypothetical protein HYQ46_012447 [Verticillium longisporum]|nr:hypothetical protein HYQ46_012447 [Verticillium longisporum]